MATAVETVFPLEQIKEARDVLVKAKHLLVTDGWCKNTYQSSTCRRCLAGAVYAAAGFKFSVIGELITNDADGNYEHLFPVADLAFDYLDSEIHMPFSTQSSGADLCVAYNDLRNTTQEDIFTVLDHAIRRITNAIASKEDT